MIALIFGSLIAWIQYSKSSRELRLKKQYEEYEVLSEKLCGLYLLMIEAKRKPEKHNSWHETQVSCARYLLTHKLNISGAVSDAAFDFIRSPYSDLDAAMEKINKVLGLINKELGLDATDAINRLTRLENLVQSLTKGSQ